LLICHFLYFFVLLRRPLRSTLFPYTTLFRSGIFTAPKSSWPRFFLNYATLRITRCSRKSFLIIFRWLKSKSIFCEGCSKTWASRPKGRRVLRYRECFRKGQPVLPIHLPKTGTLRGLSLPRRFIIMKSRRMVAW